MAMMVVVAVTAVAGFISSIFSMKSYNKAKNAKDGCKSGCNGSGRGSSSGDILHK